MWWKSGMTMPAARVKSPQIRAEGGLSSEPAFDESQECLRVRGLLALPVSLLQPRRLSEVKAVHLLNTAMSPVVQ